MISVKDKIFITVLMAAGFLGSLSQNLLTSALPSIIVSFGIDAAVGQWLTTVYILVLGVITAVSAYIFYRFHTKILIQMSLIIFLLGCIMALFAPTFPVLLISRIIQACGAGILIPLLQIVVLYIYPPERQGQALGLTSIIVGFAPAIGPTLSGILVDSFGWQSIFVLLIISSVIVLIISQFVLQEIGERKQEPLDFLSAILYSAGFTAFMLSVTCMKSGGIIQFKTLLLFSLGILFLFIFTKRQAQNQTPLLKMSLLKFKPLLVGTILLSITYIMMLAGTILVPLYIQTVCGHSATLSGLILLPGSLLIAISGPITGHLADRHGAKKLSIFGMIFMELGTACFLFFQVGTEIPAMTFAYAIRSMGIGILITTCTTLGVQYLPLEDKPHGSAILNSLRQMSGSLFSTILVIISTVASGPGTLNINGIHASFAVMTVISAIGLLLSIFAVRAKR